MKDLLRTEHLSRGDVDTILTTAREFASNPLKAHHTLAGKSVAIYMTKPSTRTRLASETAVAHLGGHPIFLRSDDLQLGRGETIADTARVISGFADAMIIRTFKQSDVDELGRHATIPVINGLTDEDHPTQLLADWTTIFEHFGSDIAGRKFAPQGRFAPDTNAVKKAQEIATTSGARIEVVHDAKEAASGASVLYTDVWMSMGDPESDRSEKIQALAPFKVDDSLMKLAASDAVFMHCLPAHREEEVATTVIDGARSLIWRQAFHRRTTIQAILFHLLRGDLKGRK
ncbi:MAG: ornithine carbamoyltransferase [Actinobacteria bacterium]|nr:ornithine carbamoyltransferase [Actinomycetota bacterium]